VGFAGANIKFAYLNHPRTGRTDVSCSFLILSSFSNTSSVFPVTCEFEGQNGSILVHPFSQNDRSQVLFAGADGSVIYHLIAWALPNVMVESTIQSLAEGLTITHLSSLAAILDGVL